MTFVWSLKNILQYTHSLGPPGGQGFGGPLVLTLVMKHNFLICSPIIPFVISELVLMYTTKSVAPLGGQGSWGA